MLTVALYGPRLLWPGLGGDSWTFTTRGHRETRRWDHGQPRQARVPQLQLETRAGMFYIHWIIMQ